MDFCKQCGNRLKSEPDAQTGIMVLECVFCSTEYKSKPENTLLYTKNFEKVNIIEDYENLIKNAPYNPANPIIKKSCPKCKAPEVWYVELGDEMKTVYSCKCGYYWV